MTSRTENTASTPTISVVNANGKSNPNTSPPIVASVRVAKLPTRLSNTMVSRIEASATGTTYSEAPPTTAAMRNPVRTVPTMRHASVNRRVSMNTVGRRRYM